MSALSRRFIVAWVALAGLLVPLTGCPGDLADILDELDLEDIELRITSNVAPLQQQDPRLIVLPQPVLDRGDTVIINNNVVIVNDVQQDVIIAELPDSLLLGFENITGFDAYIRYLVDGVEQGIFVFDGETLLLDYPCAETVDLLSEEHFDVFTGELVEAFDLSDFLFDLGFDFECGDAFIITFAPEDIGTRVELIDLLE